MKIEEIQQRTVLWWGRFNPDYSRNRILQHAFRDLGWRVVDFHPRLSRTGHLEAALKRMKTPDLIWLPAFRQRDMAAAANFARARRRPLIFDPMISAYDKQVFEQRKFEEGSAKAEALLKWERALFAHADYVIADTAGHADFYRTTLNVPAARLRVVALGAEGALFTPGPLRHKPADAPLEALFFGSFINLQAPEVIVEAAKLCPAPVRWVLLGAGPLRAACEAAAAGHPNIAFEDYLPYEMLPGRIRAADILLGIFGESDKAARVIPNKVYQALSAGRVVVTRQSGAYPEPKTDGLIEVAPNDPAALSNAVQQLAAARASLPARGQAARDYYDKNFSISSIHAQLADVIGEFSR
ncbi:glycosyltransferase [Sneathiella sp.]|uniref:glycosyltransferase n=1 Tax=Sneathiella sp. TaxID=1964365 RepID=UPI002FE34F31